MLQQIKPVSQSFSGIMYDGSIELFEPQPVLIPFGATGTHI